MDLVISGFSQRPPDVRHDCGRVLHPLQKAFEDLSGRCHLHSHRSALSGQTPYHFPAIRNFPKWSNWLRLRNRLCLVFPHVIHGYPVLHFHFEVFTRCRKCSRLVSRCHSVLLLWLHSRCQSKSDVVFPMYVSDPVSGRSDWLFSVRRTALCHLLLPDELPSFCPHNPTGRHPYRLHRPDLLAQRNPSCLFSHWCNSHHHLHYRPINVRHLERETNKATNWVAKIAELVLTYLLEVYLEYPLFDMQPGVVSQFVFDGILFIFRIFAKFDRKSKKMFKRCISVSAPSFNWPVI